MAEQYKINEFISYSTTGVCRIDDIKEMELAGRTGNFYILKPLSSQNSTVFVPMDNPVLTAKMRRVLTKEEIDKQIDVINQNKMCWINERKDRIARIKEILAGGETADLLLLISCMYIKRNELSATNKDLSSFDDLLLKRAENLIEDEFSFVLGIEKNEVSGYIESRIN